MEVMYHEIGAPIPAGWRYAGPLMGHHGLRYFLLERVTPRIDKQAAAR